MTTELARTHPTFFFFWNPQLTPYIFFVSWSADPTLENLSEARREQSNGHHERGVQDSPRNPVSIFLRSKRIITYVSHASPMVIELCELPPAYRSLDKAVSSLEMELAVERARSSAAVGAGTAVSSLGPQKAFVVIGINTAFSSKKRRDSLRDTWVPRGHKNLQQFFSDSQNAFFYFKKRD